MYKLLIILLLVSLTTALFSQPTGYKPLNDQTVLRRELQQSASQLKTFKCQFTQEKTLTLLDEVLTSHGTIVFKQINKLRIEYTSPYKYLLVINGDKVYIKDDQSSNAFSAGNNHLFKTIQRIMMDCIRGTILDNKSFKYNIFIGDKYYLVEMMPLSKDLNQIFKSFRVYIDKKDHLVDKLEMLENTGDISLFKFKTKIINPNIADAEFIVK